MPLNLYDPLYRTREQFLVCYDHCKARNAQIKFKKFGFDDPSMNKLSLKMGNVITKSMVSETLENFDPQINQCKNIHSIKLPWF